MCKFWFQCIWVCAQDCYIWMTWKLYFKLSWNVYTDFYGVSTNSSSHQESRSFFSSPFHSLYLMWWAIVWLATIHSTSICCCSLINCYCAINPDIGFWAFYLFILCCTCCVCMCAKLLCVSRSRAGRSGSLLFKYVGSAVWTQVTGFDSKGLHLLCHPLDL